MNLLGFIVRGYVWDIPILIFAYVLFWGPIIVSASSIWALLTSFVNGIVFRTPSHDISFLDGPESEHSVSLELSTDS